MAPINSFKNDQLTQSTQLIKPNHLLIPPPFPRKKGKNTSTQFLKKLIPSIQNKLCLHPQPPPPPIKNIVSHLPWESSTKYDNMHIQLSVLPVGCKTCIIFFNCLQKPLFSSMTRVQKSIFQKDAYWQHSIVKWLPLKNFGQLHTMVTKMVATWSTDNYYVCACCQILLMAP